MIILYKNDKYIDPWEIFQGEYVNSGNVIFVEAGEVKVISGRSVITQSISGTSKLMSTLEGRSSLI